MLNILHLTRNHPGCSVAFPPTPFLFIPAVLIRSCTALLRSSSRRQLQFVVRRLQAGAEAGKAFGGILYAF
jgi:hypothetical protein